MSEYAEAYFDECMKLKAEIERLRAELGVKYREGYDNALAEQPFDRAAAIEECAKVAEECYDNPNDDMGYTVPTAIRALKER